MGIYKATNFASSTLAGPLTAVSTTLTIQTGVGDDFPEITGTDFTYLVLEDDLLNHEIIKVTARAAGADSMTIARAQLGTSARSWLAGDLIECCPEASQFADTINHVNAASGAHNASAIAVTPAGNLAADDVQEALTELDGEKLGLATGGTVSGAVDFTGTVTFDGAAGSAGQVLVSQGTGATPAFGSSPSEMGTTGTGTGTLLVYNNSTGALELADLAARADLVDYRVANLAGTEYEIGSGTITLTNTGGVTWTETYGDFDGMAIYSTAYGAGVRVAAVGGNGKVLYSTDDITWTLVDAGFGASSIYGVTFAGGQFIANGSSGKLATSPDGIVWTQRASATTALGGQHSYGKAAYNGSTYVVIGAAGYIASSTDGITWTNRKSSGDDLYGVAWGNGYFIAVGAAGAMFASTDGTTWNTRTSGFGATEIRNVCYGNVGGTTPTFIAHGASGTVTFSTDATFTTWSAATSGMGADYIYSSAYTGSRFVICGDSGKISYDTDGQGSWSAVTPLTTLGLRGVDYSNSKCVIVGEGALRLTSADGITWALSGSQMAGQLATCVATDGTTTVVAGAIGTLVSSTDLSTWTSRSSGIGANTIYDVVFGARFLAVGDVNFSSSADGASWSSYTSPLGADSCRGATYGNGVYVAVGATAKLYTSSTALTGSWTSRTSGFTADLIYAAAYADVAGTHTFVAVGAAGKIASSTDGSATTWTLRTSPTATALTSVTHGGGKFVAVGGDIGAYSTDGVTWHPMSMPAGYSWQRVCYGGGIFVAVALTGKIATSPNGITWTLQTSGTTIGFYGVLMVGTSYLVVGQYGTLNTSPVGVPALSLARSSQYITSNANSIVSFSAGTKNVGLSPRSVGALSIPTADFALSAASGVQAAFPATGDVLTVAGETTYEFEGQYILNTGTTSHTTALAFALATATVSSFEYVTDAISAAANTPAATQTTHVSGVASTVVAAATTAVYTIIKFKGIARFTIGGTITPKIDFSANPTGSNLMKAGSYIKFTPLGANDLAVIGPWA